MPRRPKPIDTSRIRIPRELAELSETLARNIHDVWSRRRKAEGWRYGPRRDASTKTHASLIPYEDLPDSEKEYDRATAMETLKVLMALGYGIRMRDRARESGAGRRLQKRRVHDE